MKSSAGGTNYQHVRRPAADDQNYWRKHKMDMLSGWEWAQLLLFHAFFALSENHFSAGAQNGFLPCPLIY
jgi:sulfite exporter TauE/SafE